MVVSLEHSLLDGGVGGCSEKDQPIGSIEDEKERKFSKGKNNYRYRKTRLAFFTLFGIGTELPGSRFSQGIDIIQNPLGIQAVHGFGFAPG